MRLRAAATYDGSIINRGADFSMYAGAKQWRARLFLRLASFAARRFHRRGFGLGGDGEVFQFLAGFERSGQPAGLEPPAGPGLGRVIGIAVLGSHSRAAQRGATAL